MLSLRLLDKLTLAPAPTTYFAWDVYLLDSGQRLKIGEVERHQDSGSYTASRSDKLVVYGFISPESAANFLYQAHQSGINWIEFLS